MSNNSFKPNTNRYALGVGLIQALGLTKGAFMKQRIIVLLAAMALNLGVASPAIAGKTYTPAQLRSMVQSGNYPKQGSASTQSQRMDYSACIAKVAAVVSSVQPEYPTSTVLSTNIARIEKVWTNDAAMTLSCSAPDGKLVITTAPYL